MPHATLAVSLVYGKLGLPALGVAGAGYATAITKTSELALLGALLVRDEARARRSAAKSRAIAPLAFGVALREVASLGAPTGLQFAGELLAFTTFTAVLGSLGAHEIAAHQIALSTIGVRSSPGSPSPEATSVLVGRALGERRVDRADAATRAGLGVAMAFMSLCGLASRSSAGSLARFFSPDERVVVVATRLLWVASVFQLRTRRTSCCAGRCAARRTSRAWRRFRALRDVGVHPHRRVRARQAARARGAGGVARVRRRDRGLGGALLVALEARQLEAALEARVSAGAGHGGGRRRTSTPPRR